MGSCMRIGSASVVLAASLVASAASAQTLRGVTVDAGERPITGVVVMLVDTASNVAARGLTNEKGEFRLTAASAGIYRLRTLRIGFRPTLSTPFTLDGASEPTTRVVLSDIPVMLDTMHTTGRSVCGTFDKAGAATYAVWEQIHAALTAAELTAASRTLEITAVTYERGVDPEAKRDRNSVSHRRFSLSNGVATHPWRALTTDSLHRFGYVLRDGDGSINYYAPDLETLLSNSFVEDHCFRLASDSAANLIGIAFEPISDRKKIAEIQGTLWLDRASSELRQLEFKYTNIPTSLQKDSRGGLDFVRLRDGTWVISNWLIQMPLFMPQISAAGRRFMIEPRRAGLELASGTVALVRRDTDTLWRHPPLAITGTLRDSSSGSPLIGAEIGLLEAPEYATSDSAGRFAISNLLPGTYTLAIHTPSLDSMRAVHQVATAVAEGYEPIDVSVPSAQMIAKTFCGGLRAGTGVILGTALLRNDSTSSLKSLRVTAEWNADTVDATRVRRLQSRVTEDGLFRLCGVPVNTMLMLSATADSAETGDPTFIELAPAVRLSRANLVLDRLSDLDARGAIFTGTVIADSSRQPMQGVEVALPDAGKSVLTGVAGDFRVTGIPAGQHRVLIRRLGFGPVDTTLKFTGHETVQRRVVLGRVPMLEAVLVSAKATDASLASFEEDRRMGFGHFLTQEDLDKYAGASIGNVLRQIPGINVISGRGGQTYLTSKRVVGSLSGRTCFAKVYLDGMLMNPSGEAFDVSLISVETIGAVEIFAGPSETPLRYSGLDSSCGVVVIWTRRSP